MQQYRNNRNNGNFYDLRKDLQHTPPPSQQKGSSGSADGRYGFNGEPLSFAPDRTANGTVRRTRTDNSIEFPSQPRRTEQSGTRRTSGQNRNRTAQRSRTAQPEQRASGTARKPQQRRSQGQKPRKTAAQAAQQRYKNQRLRPAQQQPRDPVQREKRKKRRLTRAALKRRRMLRRLMAFVTLLAVIAAGVYLTMTCLLYTSHQLAESTTSQAAAAVTYQYPHAGAKVAYGTTVYLYTDTYEGCLLYTSLFVLSEHCVQDGQQFTHTVNQRHFFGFSGC